MIFAVQNSQMISQCTNDWWIERLKYVRNEYTTDAESFSERFVSSSCAFASAVGPGFYFWCIRSPFFSLVQIIYWSLIFNITNCLIFLSFLWQLTVVGPNGAAGVSALPRVAKVYTSAHGPVPSPNQRAEDKRVSGTTTCHRAVLRQHVQVSMTHFNRK